MVTRNRLSGREMSISDISQRIARVEERDLARGKEIDDLKTAIKDNTSVTRLLTDAMNAIKENLAFEKGRERGFAVILGTIGAIIGGALTIISNIFIHH